MPPPDWRGFGQGLAWVAGFCVLGAVALGAVGFLIGAWSAQGYVPKGPTDPRDAPLYVQLGLTLLGAITGGTAGALTGMVWAARRGRRGNTSHPDQGGEP